MTKRTQLTRRSPHLVSFWRGERLVVVNFATGVEAFATPLILEILAFFNTWKSFTALSRAMPAAPADPLQQVVTLLIERTFLQMKDQIPAADRAMERWRFWNPSAGFFHHATRDVAFGTPGATNGRRVPRNRKRSDSIKRIPGAAATRLPAPALANEFSAVLLARRTWRRFAPGPISLADLSTMLYLTAGVQRWENTESGTAALKTSPSGGATHPGELYLFALDVAGLQRGLYHYRADSNALELIRNGGKRSDVERYLPTQWWYGRAAALVFFSAVFARSLWRYNYARAYRALLIEAGHQCQTFCLTATALRLAPFCVMALADSVIEKDLGLDGRTEAVLYVAGVGRRPPKMDWAPAPSDGAWWEGAPVKRHREATRRRARPRGV